MSTKKTEPTPRQRVAVRAQRAHGDDLRSWFHDREQKATKGLQKLFKKRRKAAVGSRGVDRVPERYRNVPREPVYLVKHEDMPRDQRRARGYKVTSGNVPHRNPERDAKSLRSGRLRKELRP